MENFVAKNCWAKHAFPYLWWISLKRKTTLMSQVWRRHKLDDVKSVMMSQAWWYKSSMAPLVQWCHQCHDVTSIDMSQMSWCHKCHEETSAIMSQVSWCHKCHDVTSVMMSQVRWNNKLEDVTSRFAYVSQLLVLQGKVPFCNSCPCWFEIWVYHQILNCLSLD